jgi:tetratricopeptide (TPR) repeat protein
MTFGNETDRPVVAGRFFLNSPQVLQLLFGIAFASAIITAALYVSNPTEFQYWVFRVVLSLAAAAVGGVASGVVDIKISSAVRVGGAAVVGAAVYLIDPPNLIVDKTTREINRLLSIADGEVADNQLADARDKYNEAAKDEPTSWRPLYGLGRVSYLLGNYLESRSYLEEAIKKPNADRKILVQIALDDEGMNEFKEALNSLENFIGESTPTDDSFKDAIFSRGQLQMWSYYDNNIVATLELARKDFNEFISLRGLPVQWAYYHLLCIDAIEISMGDVSELRHQELFDFARRTKESLMEYVGETKQYHVFLLKRLLFQNEVFKQRPGDPVPCRRVKANVLDEMRAQLTEIE